VERKLAAILCAEVYGYNSLIGEDDEATLCTLTSYRKLIDSQLDQPPLRHFGHPSRAQDRERSVAACCR